MTCYKATMGDFRITTPLRIIDRNEKWVRIQPFVYKDNGEEIEVPAIVDWDAESWDSLLNTGVPVSSFKLLLCRRNKTWLIRVKPLEPHDETNPRLKPRLADVRLIADIDPYKIMIPFLDLGRHKNGRRFVGIYGLKRGDLVPWTPNK